MLPSRGLSRNPASALRYSLSSRIKPTRTAPARPFSQAQSQSQSSVLSRRALTQFKASQYGQITPSSISAARYGASAGMTCGVFAQRSGAARNLSLWPFRSQSQPQTPPTPAESSLEPLAQTQAEAQASAATHSPVAETPLPPSPAPSPPASEPASSAVDLSQLPEDLFSDLDFHASHDIPERIGYLSELGLDYGWGPTTMCQWFVEHLYVYTGMPWWATIAAAAVIFRAVMFYPTLVGAKHQARMQKAQTTPAYLEAKAALDEAAWLTKDRQAMLQARSDMQRALAASGASSWKPFVAFAVMPFSFGMFRLLRGMSSIPVPSLETGGLAWFTDLTVHDPFFILPIISVGMGSLMMSKMQRANAAAKQNELQQSMMKGMKYLLPPLMFLGTAWLPAGLQWFFLWVSAGSVLQAQATITPLIRRWVGLPPLARPNHRPAALSGAGAAIQYQQPTKPGIRATLEEGMTAASKTFKEATGATEERTKLKKAQEYEAKRAEEEKQRAFQRMEEVRRRRAERRS
ncbi:hypothetical protein GGR55DRAFT_690376 [Xylaria sp. FL0064]|nr:hypothetical protein GGR55DRAFT_690376 [Xylaria sp. FL0064]